MEPNQPPFIKYEKILLDDDYESESSEPESLESEEDKSSISEEDDDDSCDEEGMPKTLAKDLEKAQAIRNNTISRILDSIFLPRKIEENGKKYLLRLSRKPATREEVVELAETFDKYLKERQVRMTGFCPIRRELYDLLFDELIRQVTINSPERGSLLLRVRDEFRMTMTAYERLFESGVVYGTRKASEAEQEEKKLENEYKQLQDEVERAENRVKQLQAGIEAEETMAKQKLELEQKRHEDKMEFLKKLNKQLNEQISYIK